MSTIDPDRWRILSRYLDQAFELGNEERTAWLESLRAEDPTLAADLAAALERMARLDREAFLAEDTSVLRPQSSLAGQELGNYTLETPVGHGGMGSVWLARRSDGRFESKVAIKLLNAGLVGRASEERFRREGAILARLSHANIARLLDAGVSVAGQPYLVLENVEGQRIDGYCDARALGIAPRIRVFLDVLAAVAHAHAHLIVHRDIKPSNVLVTHDGQVKLLDFGIAKLLEDELPPGAELTRDGTRALTPEYAAPEQVLGAPVTTATDIYSLGVLLYSLLAGQHPAGPEGRSAADLVKAIVDTEPARLSDVVVSTRTLPPEALHTNAVRRGETPERLRRVLRGDLENIVSKALKKRPQERYASIAEFAADLQRYLDHRPVSARPDSLAYRTAMFVRRNRAVVSLAVLALVAMFAGFLGTVTQAERAMRQAALAEEQRSRADAEARSAREQRDFAQRQLSRAEAINELNAFVLTDAAPSGKPFTVGDLLARAVGIVERQYAPHDANGIEMLIALGRQYSVMDEGTRARELLGRAYERSRGLPELATRSKAACSYARELAQFGEGGRAEELYQKAIAVLPDEPQYDYARLVCLMRGSSIAQDNGDTEAGVERMRAAIALLERLPARSIALQLHVSMDLAEAYRVAGNGRAAAVAFEEAHRLLARLGRENTQNAGTLFNNWGLTLSEMGRPLEAEKLFRRAIEISSADAGLQGVSPMLLTNMARVLGELDRTAEAVMHAERAYALARRTGQEVVVNQSLSLRATLYREQGHLARSRAMLEEARARYRRFLPEGHAAFAALELHEALLAQARRDLKAAWLHAGRAYSIADGSGERLYMLPRVLLVRSAIALELSRPADAHADASRAHELFGEASPADLPSSKLGEALLAIGSALRAQGEHAAAREAATKALAHLQPSLGAGHPKTRAARQFIDAGAQTSTAGSP
jgi:eukaryotic-like serine/threonine-protein kinase